MSENKNPYEIRLAILHMAQELETNKYFAVRERALERWRRESDMSQTIPPEPTLPEFPTEESIVKKAQFLGEFINQKEPKKEPEVLNERRTLYKDTHKK